uniref:Uncharacterized protein n=1 Tax=Dunaliella tertiolecta TaxID=3047 RepID=A0A7S3R3G7_DUNTE
MLSGRACSSSSSKSLGVLDFSDSCRVHQSIRAGKNSPHAGHAVLPCLSLQQSKCLGARGPSHLFLRRGLLLQVAKSSGGQDASSTDWPMPPAPTRLSDPWAALLMAWHASRGGSLLAAQCLVEAALQLHFNGTSFTEIQIGLKLATLGGDPSSGGSSTTTSIHLLDAGDEAMLLSWVALVLITAQEVGVVPKTGGPGAQPFPQSTPPPSSATTASPSAQQPPSEFPYLAQLSQQQQQQQQPEASVGMLPKPSPARARFVRQRAAGTQQRQQGEQDPQRFMQDSPVPPDDSRVQQTRPPPLQDPQPLEEPPVQQAVASPPTSARARFVRRKSSPAGPLQEEQHQQQQAPLGEQQQQQQHSAAELAIGGRQEQLQSATASARGAGGGGRGIIRGSLVSAAVREIESTWVPPTAGALRAGRGRSSSGRGGPRWR